MSGPKFTAWQGLWLRLASGAARVGRCQPPLPSAAALRMLPVGRHLGTQLSQPLLPLTGCSPERQDHWTVLGSYQPGTVHGPVMGRCHAVTSRALSQNHGGIPRAGEADMATWLRQVLPCGPVQEQGGKLGEKAASRGRCRSARNRTGPRAWCLGAACSGPRPLLRRPSTLSYQAAIAPRANAPGRRGAIRTESA